MSRSEKQVQMDTSEFNVLFVHSALDDYPLTPEEFRVYSHLARRASSGAAYPAVENMAKACRMHPDTVRRCLGNLIAYKMIEAHERRGRTTLYTLTKFSRWVKPDVVLAVQAKQEAEGKAKRAEKKARRQQEQANPSETKGGVREEGATGTPPEWREGYPSGMEGGDPPETKGDEGNPLRGSIEGSGVSNVVEDAREANAVAQPVAAPVAEPSPPPHTTFEASPSTDVKAVREQSASVAVLSPDGEAADAAITDTELDLLFGNSPEGLQETQQVESGEKVPGAAAAGLHGAPVAEQGTLRAIARDELLTRPAATPADTTYKLVKGLVGGNKAISDGILDTLTPAGALPRQDWLRLTEEELALARQVAQAQAQAEKLNFYTCAIRALDTLIGAPVGQTGTRGAPMVAVTPNAGCHAPAQRFEEADRSSDVGKYDVGARWTRKGDGAAVTIDRTETVKRRSTEGLVYHLSDGKTCNALQLMTGYEFGGIAPTGGLQ